MTRRAILIAFLLSSGLGVCLPSVCFAQEPVLESRIVSVSMFKNGLALVDREVKPEAAGNYQITDIPKPVHGTLWFIGSPDLSARIVMRKVKRAPPTR